MRTTTLLVSLLSYILLLISLLLVTYDSSLLSNVPPTWIIGPPISKIAVIIVLDGLGQRAWDNTMANRSSLLTNISREYGISGVVKANAPTESSTRHTALLAGFEENIANIKTGWSRSFQPFASVFNNVEVSWAFGTQSVLKNFNANIRRMSHTDSPSDAEVYQDFVSSADSILKELRSQKNYTNESTRGKIVFFNFASTDIAGHIGGSSSPDYLKAVIQADNFAHAVFEFFRQKLSKELMNKTTFIITSDHGVVPSGGHGGDSVNEIYVPIFIWGGGIVREKSLPIMRRLDSISGYQILLNQVDICPLIASILGIKIPSNSMGSLPVELLDVSPARKLQLLLSNNRHLQSLLEATIERIKSTSFFPFLTTEREEPLMMQPRLHETEQLIHEQRRMEGRLISRLNSFRWLTWWSFSPLWLSLITMISLNLISAALMSEPSSEVLHRRCAKYVLALVLLVECLSASAASVSPRELTLVTLLCLLAYTFLDGTAKSLRNKFKSYLANAKLTTGAPTAAIPCLRSVIIFLSFLFMLSGFYVKSLLGLSVLSTLAAQVISIKLHRMLLAYLCVVSSSLASCILLIEEFRNQEKPPNGVLICTKFFGLLAMGLWVAGNVFFSRKLAVCEVGYSELAHKMYTTLLTNVQFVLALSIYLFGLDLFSDMARKIGRSQKLSIAAVLSGVIPMLLLVVTHVRILAWQRKSVGSGHQALQNQNAIALFLLFGLSQLFCLFTMRGHGTWAEIGASLAYTLVVPALCLLTGLLFLTLRW